jgi:methionyl-tRNA formyltransferase
VVAGSPLRLAFFGSAEFSVPSLQALLEAGHDVVAVYTQPPRPAGRGHRPRPSPVHAFAQSRGLAVRTPRSLKPAEVQSAYEALGLDAGIDAGIVAAYGLILPGPILDTPRLGCLNVHASLLPRWRGAAPIQRAILAGDAESGITIMQVDRGLDTGPILLAEPVPIGASTTAQTLHDTLAEVGARLIVEALRCRADGTLTPRPQPDEGVTYAHKVQREEGRIDWEADAPAIERAVRAFTPWPGVWFEAAGGERVRVLQAEVGGRHGEPAPARTAPFARTKSDAVAAGTVLDERLAIACGSGVLRPLVLQRGGRTALDAEAFLRGFPLPPGTRLA